MKCMLFPDLEAYALSSVCSRDFCNFLPGWGNRIWSSSSIECYLTSVILERKILILGPNITYNSPQSLTYSIKSHVVFQRYGVRVLWQLKLSDQFIEGYVSWWSFKQWNSWEKGGKDQYNDHNKIKTLTAQFSFHDFYFICPFIQKVLQYQVP